MDNPKQWSRIESIFHGALERNPPDRPEYLSRECAGDDDLRKRVESLLENDDRTSLLDKLLIAPVPEQILGCYRLVSILGEGGMGTVYLARDTRLDREVALKVLNKSGSDADRKRRLLREAKAASALNHPNIVTVYDVSTVGEVDFLVMEYVPGKPLDRLIPRNGLKVNEATGYALQIADALACAHRAGIIHRDLKPANVLITQNGVTKVADFGIARQVRTGGDPGTLTQQGLIFGTVAYMSPEQAEGKTVDARSDIFSFGSLLYEMVTGRRAFQRETPASTLAAVLREEPQPASAAAEEVPRQLTQVIERCLRKLPADRFQTMDDLKVALREPQQKSQTDLSPVAVKTRTQRHSLLWPAAAGIAAIAIAVASIWYATVRSPDPVLMAVPLTTYPGFESSASFSPDGMQVAFSWCKYEATPVWHNQYLNACDIYVKQIGVEPPSRLTETAAKEFSPAWSPDGKWIAFLRLVSSTRLALIRIPQRGGRERVLLEHDLSGFPEMPPGPHLAWTPDSQWLVCTTPLNQQWVLSLVSAGTGETRVLTRPSRSVVGDTAPAIAPDGRTLLFSRFQGRYDLHKLRLSEQYAPLEKPTALRSEDRQNATAGILAAVLSAAWLADGRAIVVASKSGDNGLWRTSASSGATSQRLPFAPTSATDPAVSRRGNRLAYTAYREDTNIWRIELGGHGHDPTAPAPLNSSTKADDAPACSPDGKRVAFISERSGSREVWLCDRDGSNAQQLTSIGGKNITGPQWSPDGQSIALWTLDGLDIVSTISGALRHLPVPGGGKWPSWSRDGQWLYFASRASPNTLWKVRPDGGSPVQITHGSGGDMPQASLDGKYIYYNTGYPGPLSIWRIPVAGGESIRMIDGVSTGGHWTPGIDGIYYFATPDAKGRSEMRFYEFATGRTKSILTIERSVGVRIAVCPDARTIFYPQTDEQGSDLMLVENFR